MLVRALVLATVLCLGAIPLAHADDSTTPLPIPASTTAPAPASPSLPATSAPATEVPSSPAPPVVDNTPVIVAPERSTPITQLVAPNTPIPTAGVETQSTVPPTQSGPIPTVPPSVSRPTPAPTSANAAAPPDLSTLPSILGNDNASTTSPPAAITLSSASAQAPSQLTCHGKHHPTAAPFLQSPYNGWTAVASFVDHDGPDYTVDGRIVLANGLQASVADGQASDYFPAYWSPTLRQFINYDGHNGYDLELSYQPVLAAAGGTVEYAGWNSPDPGGGYGQMVLINHHNGYVTLYGHLSTLEVRTGDKVIGGQEIGISGSTGHSSGPHLHFSVFHDCQVTDPYGWTGQGHDPLVTFNGEHASYLWLPGHDPLLLNPPPNWPAYSLSLKINLPKSVVRVRLAHRRVPPVARLLLLSLSSPGSSAPVSAGVALARTEALITAEAEMLTPRLDQLRAEGLLDNYEIVPAAAAIWVHGTATSAQLEGLDGVASLGGVQPRDLLAAEAGLAHAVLIQIRHQQAPALWPAGFRSGIHTWRPTATVLAGHSLVAGLAQPGQSVTITLRRGVTPQAVASATGDNETGGFVAMLHDSQGQPVATRPGDIVSFAIGGREVDVPVLPVTVQARAQHVWGRVPDNSTVGLALVGVGQGQTRIMAASATGRFAVIPAAHLRAGTLAVTTVLTPSGNQECASAFVPGLEVHEGEQLIRGWTVGARPLLTLRRAGKLMLQRVLHPAPDGAFTLELAHAGTRILLHAGDAVTLGSISHHHTVILPPLAASLTAGVNHIQLTGPARSLVTVSLNGVNRRTSTDVVSLSASGSRTLALHSGPITIGDQATVEYFTPQGDTVVSSAESYGMVLHEGSGTITGQARPGTVLDARVLNGRGRNAGSALIEADGVSGKFHTRFVLAGRPVRLTSGHTLVVRDGVRVHSYPLTGFSARLHRAGALYLSGHAGSQLHLTIFYRGGSTMTRSIRLSAHGQVIYRVPAVVRSQRILVTQSYGASLAIQRTIITSPPACGGTRANARHRHLLACAARGMLKGTSGSS